MKFQIWCTVHDQAVHGDDYTIRSFTPDTFEVDLDHVYCRWGSEDPADHKFVLKVPGDMVILEEPK